MPDTQTTHYNFTKPENGASEDNWGTKLNQNWDDADAAIKAAKDQADNALQAAGSADPSGIKRFAAWIGA